MKGFFNWTVISLLATASITGYCATFSTVHLINTTGECPAQLSSYIVQNQPTVSLDISHIPTSPNGDGSITLEPDFGKISIAQPIDLFPEGIYQKLYLLSDIESYDALTVNGYSYPLKQVLFESADMHTFKAYLTVKTANGKCRLNGYGQL